MIKGKIDDFFTDVTSMMIAGHTRPDGDSVGSCLALYSYVKENYPHIEVDVRLEEVPESYRVVPGWEDVITTYSDEKSYDLFVALDVSDKERLEHASKYFDGAKKTICIDHHISNDGFADINHIVPDASSACEVLCDLMYEDRISKDTATALYVGIICDSGVFKYNSTGRHTMEMAGMLMEKGIDYTGLIDRVFYEKSFLQNQVMAHCLMNSKLSHDGRIISCILEQKDQWKIGAKGSDLEGIVSQMKLTRGTEVSVFIHGVGKEEYRLSLRSSGKVDVRRIAETFGGGGHMLAAGATLRGNIEEIYPKLDALIQEQL